MRRLALVLCIIFGLGIAVVGAQDVKQRIRNIVHQVKAYYAQHGLQATLRAVSPDGQFGVKVLGGNYAWILRTDGIMVSHGANSLLNGKNFFILRDSEGRQFVKEFVIKAKQGGGYTYYKWTHPQTHRIAHKVAYCEMLTKDLVVCAGAYLDVAAH